jgi:hypothetical protein
MVTSRLARYSYGICLEVPFNSSIHLLKDRRVDIDGEILATDQMTWLIRKVRLGFLDTIDSTTNDSHQGGQNRRRARAIDAYMPARRRHRI